MNLGSMNLPINTVNSGWTCGSCGSWVPNGTSHLCHWPNQLPLPPAPITGFTMTVPADNSALILAELREIKELLKGLRK